MKLQMADNVVKSIMQIRPIFPEMTDEAFAAWYSDRYRITLPRVLRILEVLKNDKG